MHVSVMPRESLELLAVKPDGVYLDCTTGLGGHTRLIAERLTTGYVLANDRDQQSLAMARENTAAVAERICFHYGGFGSLAEAVSQAGFSKVDGLLADLGVSRYQLTEPSRGFSFMQDGPLDMRMDTRQPFSAADLLNTASAEELARIFWEFGGERESRRFARAIVRDREAKPFHTTRELAELIERLDPRRGAKTHPATKVFQALRLAVNDEIGSLQRGLEGAVKLLRPGGRLAVITFHSLEDRLVKDFGRVRTRDYTFTGGVDVPELREPRAPELSWVTPKAIKPRAQELSENPRARSAQLRALEKLTG